MGFLAHIREWGKKVVFIVNGVDRRNSDEQVGRVRDYLAREITARLGGDAPTTYFISALQSLRAKVAARSAAALDPTSPADGAASATLATPATPASSDARNEFPALERYLLETLRERERVRLKLLSPLGVLRHVLERNIGGLDTRLEVVHADGRVLGVVREQLESYGAEMRTDSERYLLEVRSVLGEIERRGRSWLERTIRIGNLNFLRNKDAVENRFRAEVVADAPRQIEDVVNRMVDWTVKRNLKLWTAVFQELDAHTARLRASGALAAHASTEFQYNREELFDRLRQPVERRLSEYNAEAEARGVVESVREAVTHAFGINVLAVGLGAVVMAVFTTAALDITGLLTATLFAVAGWLLIPARRRRLIKELEEKIATLSTDLSALLSTKFNEQLQRYEQELLDVIQPYERFLTTEREKLERGLAALRGSQQETTTLERRIVDTFPEG